MTNVADFDYGVDMFCSVCDKDMNGMFWVTKGQPNPGPFYCSGCKRAIRIAQMKAAGTLPDLDRAESTQAVGAVARTDGKVTG